MYGYPDYQTGMYGAIPQMQDRLNRMEQACVPPIRGRAVTSVEEARAAQIGLDGTPSFFPSPSEGKVYEKAIDLNGMPVFKVYVLSKGATQNTLESRISELEKAVSMLKGGNGHEPNATHGTAEPVE